MPWLGLFVGLPLTLELLLAFLSVFFLLFEGRVPVYGPGMLLLLLFRGSRRQSVEAFRDVFGGPFGGLLGPYTGDH